MTCPCGSHLEYEKCCGLIHKDFRLASNPEKLMRARYSAFVKNNIEFIAQTNIPGTTDFDAKDARSWATQSKWQGLEIIKASGEKEQSVLGQVEFKAYFIDQDNENQVHHELSDFKRINENWYYESGQIFGIEPIKRSNQKVGRNDPCICGSGKKFKKCCGA